MSQAVWVRWAVIVSVVGVTAGVVQAEESSVQEDSTARVGAAASRESPAESASSASTAMRISMDFEDASLQDVLKTLSQQAGINVLASQDVKDRKVTLYLEDVPVLDALDQILDATGLVYERPEGSEIYIVKQKASSGAGKATETRIYRLKFARVSSSRLAKAVEALGSQTPFEGQALASASSSSGGSSGGGGGGAKSAGGGGGGGSQKDVGIDKVIERLLSRDGRLVVDERTNRLLVTELPENFPKIEEAIKALDVRTAQIVIESEILETDMGKVKDLGLEWGTGSSGQLATFTPSSRTTRFPFNLAAQGAQSTNPTSFGLSTLSFASFAGALQALERDTRTKILARPRILTLDNESAIIRLTTNEAIGFTVANQAQTSTTNSEPERETTGTLLVVTPQINDQNYITMLVEPSVTKTVASNISPPTGQATPRDPKTRSVRSLVRVRSGDTLVVGGLIDRSEEAVLKRVPLLSRIPVIGEAFTDRETTNSSNELLVFITPRIVDEPAPAQVAAVGPAPLPMREQEGSASRQQVIDDTLTKLERSKL